MKLQHPAAFKPFQNDTVTVCMVAQVAGRKPVEKRLHMVPCIVMEGEAAASGNTPLASQSGLFFRVVIHGADWDHPVPPQAETTKLESPGRGVMVVKAVARIGEDWALNCLAVDKAVRPS